MSPDGVDVGGRLELAVDAAREAGEITLESFASAGGPEVERKADGTPVTAADRRAERRLRRRIEEAFPGDGVVGEEHPDREGESGYRWILDPVDGTRSFVRGVPLYGTLVAVERDGRPEAGVIRMPALDETVWAARGGGAWHRRGGADPVRASVSDRSRLSEALFLTTEVATWRRKGAADAYRALEDRCRLARTWGDCYGYLLVATGRAEVMVDPYVNLWDAAALVPVLEEAGGTLTDWRGRPRADGGDAVATNGAVAEQVLEMLEAGSGAG